MPAVVDQQEADSTSGFCFSTFCFDFLFYYFCNFCCLFFLKEGVGEKRSGSLVGKIWGKLEEQKNMIKEYYMKTII